jgi:hypothetical protein
MKLTWFGGTTIRIHIGGAILVVDPAGAPAGIDAAELVSGADRVIENFGAELTPMEVGIWRPRKSPRVLDDDGEVPPVEAWSMGEASLLLDALGEAPLLFLAGAVPELGRWSESAAVVLFGDGDQLVALGAALLGATSPRLLVLAGEEEALDAAIPVLRDMLDGTGLVALEAGLALEV